MNEAEQQPESTPPFKRWKLIIPVVIGLGVSLYLLISTFKPEALRAVKFSTQLVIGLVLALVCLIVRDFSFVYKLRLSSGNRITWLKSLQAVIMWEFCAAVTPKLSEAAFILYVLKKAGLSYGRSTAVVMLNSFLDNLVFVIVFVILYFIYGTHLLHLPPCEMLQGHKIMEAVRGLSDKAWIGFAIMVALCIFLAVAMFIMPHVTKNLFYRLASVRPLKRFQKNLQHWGDEIELTSDEYRNQSVAFWIKMTVATFINWSTRYLLACALIWAFAVGSFDWLEAYARQYVVWIYMIIPATPGASGIAEVSFTALNCDFLPQSLAIGIAIATIWRIYTFYSYIIIGMIVFPHWMAGVVQEEEQK